MISVVIPCLNEAENVGPLFARISAVVSDMSEKWETVFIDDGSSDDTYGKICQLERRYPSNVRVIRHSANLGIVPSWKSGVRLAVGRQICLIDADLQNPPEEIGKLWKHQISHHCDLVQGARIPTVRNSWIRTLNSRLLAFLLNVVYGAELRDPKSGFILAKREVLLKVLDLPTATKFPQTFVGVSGRIRGFHICEVRTNFNVRLNGQSFLKGKQFKTSLASLADLWNARVWYREVNKLDHEKKEDNQ